MGADLSRIRNNPLHHFAGVELKQGGVMLDADFNELVAIVDRRLRAAASDILGRSTVSSTTPAAFKITALAGGLSIGKGRLYVDGLLAENHGVPSSDPARKLFDRLMAEVSFADLYSYATQPYLPSPPALPTAGRHLVYLDVWERAVTHLERPSLVEVAVGVETSSRCQTVWQVRVLAGDSGSATCASPDEDVPDWSALIAPSSGRLSTNTFAVLASDDPCDLPPGGGYRGLENQTYRVEIQDPGQPGGAATFKWSRENASVGSRVASMVSATEIELDSLGRDEVLRFNSDDWVEIIDDVREFSQRAGEVRKIKVNEAARRITFTPALPAEMIPGTFPSADFPRDRNLRVRRWDQKHQVLQTGPAGTTSMFQDLDAGSSGVIQVPAAGTVLILENGVTVSFSSSPGSKGFKAGDYWVFAARSADASVEILDNEPPRGVHHHYARLGIWEVGAGTVTDCRHPWPPQGEGHDCSCTQCVTPESHNNGQLTIQDAVDKVRDIGGSVCLHAGQYVLRAPVRITAAKSLRIRGQGPATMIAAPGAAFIVERSVAIAIEDLTAVSLGPAASAISVRTVFGLALRRLVLGVFGGNDAQGAAIALSGVVSGASIDNNLLVAPDGVRALEPRSEEAPEMLVTAVLRIDDNVFRCRDAAVKLAGPVGHAYETRMTGNQVLGSHEVGLSAEGMALPGASIRISDNNLDVHSPGIRCVLDGAWIEGNKIKAIADGERVSMGSGVEITSGFDLSGSKQMQVLANQISGFPNAGISIDAPVQELIVKLNIIENCGNGIAMTDNASGGSLSIENNHLRDIGLHTADATGAGARITVGIGITRTEAASVAGNTLRRIGLEAEGKQLIAGIAAFSVQHPRIGGNEVTEVGPVADFAGSTVAGIAIRAPYRQTEVLHNRVERDVQANNTRSKAEWFALQIDEPTPGVLARIASYTALRVDAERTLVLFGKRAYLNTITSAAAIDPATGAAAAAGQGSSASILGNVFSARGRVPAVDVTASGEVLFNDNRCELSANDVNATVLLNTPVAVISANRVRGDSNDSILVADRHARVAAIGNITTHPINAPLTAEMRLLNLIA